MIPQYLSVLILTAFITCFTRLRVLLSLFGLVVVVAVGEWVTFGRFSGAAGVFPPRKKKEKCTQKRVLEVFTYSVKKCVCSTVAPVAPKKKPFLYKYYFYSIFFSYRKSLCKKAATPATRV